ncbi:hypothetical protein [Streptomyces caelestis]|uniref:hypothetical protein n=1 Tax=Streptomyces caelestis TaxID=36816 RepID=UPI003652C64A
MTTAADAAVCAVARVLPIEERFALSVPVWAAAVALFLFSAPPVPAPAAAPSPTGRRARR